MKQNTKDETLKRELIMKYSLAVLFILGMMTVGPVASAQRDVGFPLITPGGTIVRPFASDGHAPTEVGTGFPSREF